MHFASPFFHFILFSFLWFSLTKFKFHLISSVKNHRMNFFKFFNFTTVCGSSERFKRLRHFFSSRRFFLLRFIHNSVVSHPLDNESADDDDFFFATNKTFFPTQFFTFLFHRRLTKIKLFSYFYSGHLKIKSTHRARRDMLYIHIHYTSRTP